MKPKKKLTLLVFLAIVISISCRNQTPIPISIKHDLLVNHPTSLADTISRDSLDIIFTVNYNSDRIRILSNNKNIFDDTLSTEWSTGTAKSFRLCKKINYKIQIFVNEQKTQEFSIEEKYNIAEISLNN
jgi:hypothetical protein